MNKLSPIAFVAILAACNPSQEVFVRGVVSTGEDGMLFMQECGTNRKLSLGTLTLNPSFDFVGKLDTLEVTEPIVINVMGNISPEEPKILINPQVMNFSEGNC